VNTLGAYSVSMAILLGGLIGVALLLARYRDRLHSYFGARLSVARKSVEVAPGARIMVVEIDGLTVVCGVNKTGVTTLQVIQRTTAGSET
jgi:flagellar biogenesis protein FliO